MVYDVHTTKRLLSSRAWMLLRTWIVRSIHTLYATLRRNTSSNEPDMAGIHHANKDEEREALMVLTAEEKP
ncbi:hypothetical protein C8J55DRAFT_105665 [Lentinula edodes]|uniref:Uncharacterized protein n=1 Tax=Lentinula lateritia TaxID=40482 RepID=A0A9W9B0D3_9AGAR|nr:hypothetical protein C8J55DRAFT_105665 [Lentinula edodes]